MLRTLFRFAGKLYAPAQLNSRIRKMEKDEIIIKKAENGVIIRQMVWNEMEPSNEDGSDKYSEVTTVIETPEEYSEDDMSYQDKLLFKKVAEHLQENFFHIYYDKWGKNNPKIVFEKGHKLE